jgi:hypothetical protein
MEEKYKKFLEFSWKDSPEWQMYYTNLSDIPHPSKVEHFKKRFYKLKIDPDFDVKWTPPQINSNPNNQNSHTNGSGASYSSSNNYNSQNYSSHPMSGFDSPLLAGLETLLFFCFLASIIISNHSLKIVCLALILRVLRRTGRPHFTVEYAQVLFLDEHFQMLLSGLLLMIDRINFFTLIPMSITAILNISEYIKKHERRFSSISLYSNNIYNRRVELSLMRANTEVAIGFLMIIGVFFGLNSFVVPIFFWQYLRFKYIVNNDLKITFSRLNNYITSFKNRPGVPGFVKYIFDKIQQFGEYMGRTEAGPGQAAGGANCQIF